MENEGEFFVMLTTQNGGYTPLIVNEEVAKEENELAKFKTEQEANEAAENSTLGHMFGFEVFRIGFGYE